MKLKSLLNLVLFFSFLSMIHLIAQGQEVKIESCYRLGNLIAHREDMAHLPKEKSSAIEVNYFFRRKTFTNDLHESGLSLTYGSLANKAILGDFFGLSTFYKLPIFSSDKQAFNFRVGAGVGYVTKIFNLENNQKNSAISSYLNALIDFSFNHSISISKRYGFFYGLAFKHLSNGATRVPNLGLNYPELKFGIHFNSVNKNFSSEKDPPLRLKNSIAFVGGSFFKQIIENYGVNYPVYYGTVFSQFGLKRNLSLELGLDAMYNSSLIYLFYSNKNQIVANRDGFQVGAYVGGNAHIDKLQLLIGMGGYIYDRYRLNGSIYHKLSLRYNPISNLLFGIGIKSHWLNADYFEVVGGFIF